MCIESLLFQHCQICSLLHAVPRNSTHEQYSAGVRDVFVYQWDNIPNAMAKHNVLSYLSANSLLLYSYTGLEILFSKEVLGCTGTGSDCRHRCLVRWTHTNTQVVNLRRLLTNMQHSLQVQQITALGMVLLHFHTA